MNFNEVLRIAQQAWDKTKAASDPVWNECNAHHRQVFVAKAQAVVDSGWPVDDFEHNVLKQARMLESKQEVVKEVSAEGVGAHSDEIQLEAAKRQGLIPPEQNAEPPKALAVSAEESKP